jgi:hypothetical protein
MHFEDDISTAPFKVLRRRRQQHHGYKFSAGSLYVCWKPNFPMLVEGMVSGLEGVCQEELDRLERKTWKEEGEREVKRYVGGGNWRYRKDRHVWMAGNGS